MMDKRKMDYRNVSQISDINSIGILAYAAGNKFILIDLREGKPAFRNLPTEDIHSDEVTAISFCHSKKADHVLATASRDKTAMIWDISDLSYLKCRYKFVWRTGIVSLDWQLKRCSDVLYLLDRDGILIIWKIAEKTHQVFDNVLNGHPVVLSASPYNRYLVALGHDNGMVQIVHTNRVGHVGIVLPSENLDGSIVSLSWPPHIPCPDNFNRDWSATLDLCSTTENGVIKIWNIQSKKCMIFDEFQFMNQSVTAIWHPCDLQSLFFSSPNGDLYLAEIIDDRRLDWTKFDDVEHNKHSGAIFSISYFNYTIYTFGIDNMVVLWEYPALKSLSRFPAIEGAMPSLEDAIVEEKGILENSSESSRNEPHVMSRSRDKIKSSRSSSNWGEPKSSATRSDSNSWRCHRDYGPKDDSRKEDRSHSRSSNGNSSNSHGKSSNLPENSSKSNGKSSIDPENSSRSHGKSSNVPVNSSRSHGNFSPVPEISSKSYGKSSPVSEISSKSYGKSSPVPEISSKSYGKSSPVSEISSKSYGKSSPVPEISSKSYGKSSPVPEISSKSYGKASNVPENSSKSNGKSSIVPENSSKSNGKSSIVPENSSKSNGNSSIVPENLSKSNGNSSNVPENSSKSNGKSSIVPENSSKNHGNSSKFHENMETLSKTLNSTENQENPQSFNDQKTHGDLGYINDSLGELQELMKHQTSWPLPDPLKVSKQRERSQDTAEDSIYSWRTETKPPQVTWSASQSIFTNLTQSPRVSSTTSDIEKEVEELILSFSSKEFFSDNPEGKLMSPSETSDSEFKKENHQSDKPGKKVHFALEVEP